MVDLEDECSEDVRAAAASSIAMGVIAAVFDEDASLGAETEPGALGPGPMPGRLRCTTAD
jgi:hypothetical protein